MREKALCQGTYQAEQSGNVVTITAEGSHGTPGYTVELDKDPILIFPPQWTLFHIAPSGILPQLVTPFSLTTQFHTEGTIKEVIIHDKAGRHVVAVTQKGKAALAAAGCK